MDFNAIAQYIEDTRPQPVWKGDAIIVDAKNLIYRLAHHEPDAASTAIVFLEKLVFLRDWYQTSRLIVGWEGDGTNWRSAHLPNYKGNRDRGTELGSKVETAIKILRSILQLTVFEQATTRNAEGDDVFGTLAAQLEAQGLKVAIYSMDRDLWQLATEGTTIIVPKQSAPDFAITPADVEQNVGVMPNLIPDLKGLQGDPGDNIPGVKGIGKQVALSLITKHGSFDALMLIAAELEQLEGEANAAFDRRVRSKLGATSKKLAAIKRDADQARASYLAGAIKRDVEILMIEPRAATLAELRGELSRLGANDWAMERAHTYVNATCNYVGDCNSTRCPLHGFGSDERPMQ